MVRSLSQRATDLLVGVAAPDKLKRLAIRAASACRCARNRRIWSVSPARVCVIEAVRKSADRVTFCRDLRRRSIL